MKVLHFVSSRGMGRGEVYVELVNSLATSMEVVLLIPKDSRYQERVSALVEVIEYSTYNSRNNPILLLDIYKKIKKIKPDVVHTHFSKASQIFNLLNTFLNLPHVATKHNPRKGKIYNRLPNVIAVSRAVKESIENENVKVIYNGISYENIKMPKKNDVFTIVAIGRLEKVKGFDILIEECAKLVFAFHLKIIGEGKERANLEVLIDRLHMHHKVSLEGFRHDVPQIIADANVVVISSRSEGFGMIILESLLYAKMLISRKVGAAEEILNPMFLVDDFNLAEKIEEVYRNEKKYRLAFKENAEKMKDRFLLESIAREHIMYYESIIQRERGNNSCN